MYSCCYYIYSYCCNLNVSFDCFLLEIRRLLPLFYPFPCGYYFCGVLSIRSDFDLLISSLLMFPRPKAEVAG